MMNKKIAILGCGWLGRPLARMLLGSGHFVNGSTTTVSKLTELQKEGISAYLIKAEPEISGENLMAFFDVDVLILNIPPGRRRPDVKTFHVLQIKSIIEKALESGIKNILFLSSTSVYPNLDLLINEKTEVGPRRDSGIALVEIEKYLQALTIPVSILRLAGLVGPERLAGRFFAGKKDIPGGLNPVNMVHQLDVIQIISQLLEKEIEKGIYNIVADEHPSRAEFYKSQAKKQGFEIPQFLTDTAINRIISNQKIKEKLAYTFSFPNPMDF